MTTVPGLRLSLGGQMSFSRPSCPALLPSLLQPQAHRTSRMAQGSGSGQRTSSGGQAGLAATWPSSTVVAATSQIFITTHQTTILRVAVVAAWTRILTGEEQLDQSPKAVQAPAVARNAPTMRPPMHSSPRWRASYMLELAALLWPTMSTAGKMVMQTSGWLRHSKLRRQARRLSAGPTTALCRRPIMQSVSRVAMQLLALMT
jgi:hypothetical protein